MTPPPRTNSLVELLQMHAESDLSELAADHPAALNKLRRGRQLGETPSDDAHRPETYQLEINLALRALRVAQERVEPNLLRLRTRLARAKTLRLIGSVTAAITSAGLFAALLAEANPGVAIGTACVNFAAATFALVASHLETPLHGGEGSLVDLFEDLANTTVEADQLIQRLEIARASERHDEGTSALLNEANAVAARLMKAERMLWGTTRPRAERPVTAPALQAPAV